MYQIWRYSDSTFIINNDLKVIRYNVVNLPDTIPFTAGHQNYYTYDASGKKLEVQNITSRNILNLPQDTITRLVSSTKLTTDYCGNAIYQNDTLKEVLTPEGYWQNGFYYYYLKDHQGSTREVLRQDNTVMEYSDYYPDGMRFWTSTSNSGALPYRYNGKELEAMNGLNEYDYGARRRETGIPVWTTIDPLCEKYYNISPYAYCGDNPENRVDPTGMIWDDPKEAEQLKNNINKQITSLNKDIDKDQAKISKGGLSDKQIAKIEGLISEAQDRISNLGTSKKDIDVLGADKNNTYSLTPIDGGEHKVLQGSDGKIHIETSSDALSIHEITHVRQSLDAGGLKFSSNGELLNSGQGVVGKSNMEVEAYQKQYSYDLSFPGRTSNLQGINVYSVGNIRNDEGTLVYPLIYEYSEFLDEQQKLLGK